MLVPLGRSARTPRVGVVLGEAEPVEGLELKTVAGIIDSSAPLPLELERAVGWFGDNWFLGYGMALKTLLPSNFLKGEELEPLAVADAGEKTAPEVKYIFDPVDERRCALYRSMLEERRGGELVLFPEVARAKSFWKSLPASLKEEGLLWPEVGQKKRWLLWQSVRRGEFSFVVGASGASCLPLPRLSRVMVDDESSQAWRSQKHPEFHRRSLLAARAGYAGAELTLGGRIPSSKAARRAENDPHAKEGAGKRLIYVNLHDAKGYEVSDIKERLPISFPLVRETRRALKAGKFALWILDRKGWAGEIYCDDCGAAVRCPRCGRVMRWEEKKNRLFCAVCKNSGEVPETCPSCASRFLAGQRPGIEAIAARAELLFRSGGDAVLFDDKMNGAELREKYPGGALLVGTRKIISLADELEIALAAWIDADGEARSTEYDSRFRAFGLIWESAWRGIAPEERVVVVQSRRPGKDWQGDLKTGWGSFWRRELKERRLLNLPPFSPIMKITMPRGKGAELARKLEERNFDFWESEERQDELWVRTRCFEKLRSLLAPFFAINSTRAGMPAVTLYLD